MKTETEGKNVKCESIGSSIVKSFVQYKDKRVTHLCTELPLLCWIATVLEGLFGEYHSSSAALGQQRPEVTKTTTCT